MSNVTHAIPGDVCTGCGTCVGTCPQSALLMCKNESTGTYQPKLTQEKCIGCKVCITNCPGYSLDVAKLNSAVFGENPKHPLLGHYQNCYIGNSIEQRIEHNSSSGGVVTALLCFALEQGDIDGALVTRMNPEKPLDAEPFIAKTKTEIISASKSKYCPVPLSSALRQIREENGKFAVVGLPCHIQGIRKAECMQKVLREKIVLHFGLFCSHTPSFLATNYLLSTLGVEKRNVAKIDYRGGRWPGGMSIWLKDNRRLFISRDHIYWGKIFGEYFYPFRCTLCSDATAELSDVSFGDPWNLPTRNSQSTLVVVRSKIGADLTRRAASKGEIELMNVEAEKVLHSQRGNLLHKKDSIRERFLIAKLSGRKVPSGPIPCQERGIQVLKLLRELLFYSKVSLTSKKTVFSPLYYPLLFYLYLNLH